MICWREERETSGTLGTFPGSVCHGHCCFLYGWKHWRKNDADSSPLPESEELQSDGVESVKEFMGLEAQKRGQKWKCGDD